MCCDDRYSRRSRSEAGEPVQQVRFRCMPAEEDTTACASPNCSSGVAEVTSRIQHRNFDDAIARRICVIPFDWRVSEETRDTMLDGGSPGTKNGSDTSLSVEAEEELVALLAWDVAGIPATAVVEAVSVTLEVSDKSSQNFDLYAARRAWSEGQATWNEYASGSAWQSGGAHGANDRGGAVLGSFSAANTGAVTVPLNAAGVAVVQGWVAQPATNLGFVLDGPGTDNRLEFRSSEYGTKSKRPRMFSSDSS